MPQIRNFLDFVDEPTELTAQQKGKFLPAQDENAYLALHGQIRGHTTVCLSVSGSGVEIHVLPAVAEGVLTNLDPTLPRAYVNWDAEEEKYLCFISDQTSKYNVLVTRHRTLKSAMRRARKYVGTCQVLPAPGWVSRFLPRIKPLTSPYPSLGVVSFAEDYWGWVEETSLESFDTQDLEIPDIELPEIYMPELPDLMLMTGRCPFCGWGGSTHFYNSTPLSERQAEEEIQHQHVQERHCHRSLMTLTM